jgi:hypothetical protein
VKITPAVIERATRALVRGLWREFQRRNPDQANPVPAYDDLRPRDRETFQRVMAAALKAAATEPEAPLDGPNINSQH